MGDKWEKSSNKHEQRSSHHGMGNDVISKALQQISKSPFVRRINTAKLHHRFSQPTFTIYNGRIDLVEHINHFNQKMTVHANNEALMCKVFPSSLGSIAIRWFDALEEGSVQFFDELIRVFRVRFITCSRVPRPLDFLLFMAMEEGETLKTYSDRYWETYNEIDGNFEDMAVRTFRIGLPAEHELRKSTLNMHQLMDHIDKYKRVEDDQIQGKGKAKMLKEKKDPWGGGYQGNFPRRDFSNLTSSTRAQLVNSLFKEPVY